MSPVIVNIQHVKKDLFHSNLILSILVKVRLVKSHCSRISYKEHLTESLNENIQGSADKFHVNVCEPGLGIIYKR